VRGSLWRRRTEDDTMDQRAELPPHQTITDIEQAAEHIRRAGRILVVGCSGGGKSTISLKIAKRFGLPYISLDRDVSGFPAGWCAKGQSREISSPAASSKNAGLWMAAIRPRWTFGCRGPISSSGSECRDFSVSGAQSADGRNGSVATARKWHRAVPRRSIWNSCASSGHSRRKSHRASLPALLNMALKYPCSS